MDSQLFFMVIAAVLIANSACGAFLYGLIRVNKTDKWDRHSASAILYAAAVMMLAGYLAN